MADPYAQFKDADPFSAYADAPTKRVPTVKPKGFWQQRGDDFLASGKAAVGSLVESYKRNTVSEADVAEARRLAAARGTKPAAELAAIGRTKARGKPPQKGVARAVDGLLAPMRRDAELFSGAAALALSPLTGVTDVALRPAARGLERSGLGTEEQNLQMFNTALMGARPVPGRMAAPRVASPKRVPVPAEVKAFKGQDPAAVRARLEEFRAAGIDPAMVDVVDDAGRGLVRATASRPTPARQATTDFRDARALDLPDRIGQQARRIVSSDPRSPVQIRDEIGARRSSEADSLFGAVRNERFSLADDAVLALRSPDGREAIKQAAKDALNSLDPADRNIANELNRLVDGALDAPGQTQMSVGMAQAISKSLLDSADVANRAGRANSSRLLGNLGRALRDNARQAVPAYDDALRRFSDDSRLIDATELGPMALRGNADEFGQAASALGQDELSVARAAMRREIERAAGENISAAPGVARRLAFAPEQRARNAALLGPDDAGRLQNNLALEERLVRNANDIAPRIGSQTFNKGEDAERAAGVMGAIQKVGRGDYFGFALDRLRTLGVRDDIAQSITEMAIDPARTDDALRALEQLMGPSQARQVLKEIASPAVLYPTLMGSQGSRER